MFLYQMIRHCFSARACRLAHFRCHVSKEYLSQAPEKLTEYWEAHCNPATAFCGARNGGAHWVYISNILKANCADGAGCVVGTTPTIADCILFDVLDLFVRIYEDGMKTNVRFIDCAIQTWL